MTLDVRHLEMVTRVVEEGSLTKAAASLNLTQPALSHRLHDLEEKLGVTIFNRVGRSLQPSAAGRHLIHTAQEVLPMLRRAEEELKRIAEGKAGTIRLSTECYTCYHWLPNVITQFQEDHPDVEVHVVAEVTRHPIPALLDDTIDLGIVSKPVRDRRLSQHMLFEDELVALVPPDHPWADHAFVVPEDFSEEHLILYTSSDSSVLDTFLLPAGIHPSRISEVQITEGILELVKAGIGITVLARWAAAPELEAGRLRAVRLGEQGLWRHWRAVTVGEDLSPAEHTLITLLQADLYTGPNQDTSSALPTPRRT